MTPFLHTKGPYDAEVVLVGEAWGAEEARAQLPFVGQSGQELQRMLNESGLSPSRILFTNVVNARPEANDFTAFLAPRADKDHVLLRGVRARRQLVEGHKALLQLISQCNPKLVIGAGNVPLWALTSHGTSKFSGIMNWRGSQTYTEEIDGTRYPYLPIAHPAAVLRAWDLRPITIHDLKARAARFLNGELDWAPPNLASTPSPDFGTACAWLDRARHLADRDSHRYKLAVDLETYARKWVACIGFADATEEICIPFFYFDGGGKLAQVYTEDQEVILCQKIRDVLRHPRVGVIGQNWTYDYQFIRRWLGISVPPQEDTMIMHHLCWPGTPKGLDYLASLYCDHYCYWKNESQEWDTKMGHEALWLYNCKDVRATYDCAHVLRESITKLGLSEQLAFQMDQWRLAQSMSDRGIAVDSTRWAKMRGELTNAAGYLEGFLLDVMPENTRFTAAGRPWYTSPKLTMDIFYRQLGLPEVRHKKTKQPTVGGDALGELKKKAPWLSPVFAALEHLRSIKVFSSHFIETKLSPDKRLRCTFYVGGTDTFRWSSSANSFDEGTNLQNIPKGDE